jgi:hypothetical protein
MDTEGLLISTVCQATLPAILLGFFFGFFWRFGIFFEKMTPFGALHTMVLCLSAQWHCDLDNVTPLGDR